MEQRFTSIIQTSWLRIKPVTLPAPNIDALSTQPFPSYFSSVQQQVPPAGRRSQPARVRRPEAATQRGVRLQHQPARAVLAGEQLRVLQQDALHHREAEQSKC